MRYSFNLYGDTFNIASDSFPYDKINKCGSYSLLFGLSASLNASYYRIRQYCTSSTMTVEIG